MTRKKRAFTLVELLIVVLILAALAAIAVPRIGESAANARRRSCETNIDIINSQIELFTANTGAAPSPLTEVTTDINYFPDGAPACAFGTAYSLDGTTGHIATAAHAHP